MGSDMHRFAIGWLSASALATVLSSIYVGTIAFALAQTFNGLLGEGVPLNFFQLLGADPIRSLLFVARLGALTAVLLLCCFVPAVWISRSVPRYTVPAFVIMGTVAGSALAPADFVVSDTGAVYFDYILAGIGALAGLLAGWLFRKPPASRADATAR